MSETNTAILLTPPGPAAIAVVRLRGPALDQFLATHFSRPVKVGRCVHGELRDGSQGIDDPLVVLCDPNTADLNLHGGPWVVRRALELARQGGFQVQETAVLPLPPDSIDEGTELEREVFASLPLARTATGVRVLLGQTLAWDALKAKAVSEPDSIAKELSRLLDDATVRHLLHPPAVAIIGAANVGKSTLANQLFAQQRAITADVPGTTRDWVGEIANIDGLPVMLADTPGIRDTSDAIEHEAIQRSRGKINSDDLLILVLDSTRPLEGEQSQLMHQYTRAIRVVNKCDRPCAWDPNSVEGLLTIATTGSGVDQLRREITRRLCRTGAIEINQAYVWTPRQQEIVARGAVSPAQATHELAKL
jgi:small GTP-binding protein